MSVFSSVAQAMCPKTKQMIAEHGHHERLMVRMADLPWITGLSLRTIARLKADGRMPSPDIKAGRAIAWRAETIKNWVEAGLNV
jgi:predicted DNA-binding transcriptional regulator AlpA